MLLVIDFIVSLRLIIPCRRALMMLVPFACCDTVNLLELFTPTVFLMETLELIYAL
jgi:hypothetical protein